ncbi:GPW/gp25 family protein [Afifella sp. H1R]|uniref:GPW/gp25 family protein n=1 Tax=Afifella sp. H1R TaxID=2908841 RepID=UPI001F2F5322|nr:GPW/gp25 family protein [Afifella sp. H1R]MCF1502908.1 GPW/gp25 family protein [Afifella sp. H1R]
MAGIDRRTGQVIDNLTSAYQGVEVTLSTRLGSRIMRREFGGGVAELLGRAMTPALFEAFRQLIGTAIDLWEPRFRVRKISLSGSVEQIRAGRAGMIFEVDYRPRGHLGDFTVERVVSFPLIFRAGGVEVMA